MNKKRKLRDAPIISGSLKYYVSNQEEKSEFMNKVDRAKLCVNEKIFSVSNYEILNKVLDFFLEAHGYKSQETTHTSQTENDFKQYLYSEKDNTEEDMFLCTKSALLI